MVGECLVTFLFQESVVLQEGYEGADPRHRGDRPPRGPYRIRVWEYFTMKVRPAVRGRPGRSRGSWSKFHPSL